MTINGPLTIATTTLPNDSIDQPYIYTIAVSGGTAPYTFSVSADYLPPDFSLNGSTGVISGTPGLSIGTYAFTITATDAIGTTSSRAYSIAIYLSPLTITTTMLPNGYVNVAYNQDVTATGGTFPTTFQVSSGSLPTGLTLNSLIGAITGTPTTASGSPFVFTITATDNAGDTASVGYSIAITTPTLTMTTMILPNGEVNQPYDQSISVSGNGPPLTFSVSAGTLPAGLSLNPSTGTISGVPTTSTYTNLGSFPVGAADVTSGLFEDSSGNLFGTTTSGGAYHDGSVFEITLGSRTITTLFSFDGGDGSDPTGGVIEDSQGNLFGTTSIGGAFNQGTVFELAANTRAFTTLVTFTLSSGANPRSGLIEDSQGNLYGTTTGGGPNSAGTVFKLSAGTYQLTDLVSFSLVGGTGQGPTLPLLIDSSGNIYGTTSYGALGFGEVFKIAAGTNAFTVLAPFTAAYGYPLSNLVEDSSGNLYGISSTNGGISGTIVFKIAAGSNTLSTVVSSSDFAFSGWLLMDGGGNIIGYNQVGNTIFKIPAGTSNLMTLMALVNTSISSPLIEDSAGNFYGADGREIEKITPGIFTITATDAAGLTASETYSPVIISALSIAPPTLVVATPGTLYSQTAVISGGMTPYTNIAVTAFNGGTTGLSSSFISANDSTGVITLSGTPNAVGTATFTVTVTDSFGATLTWNYTLYAITTFGVSSAIATPSGVVLTFNAPIDPSTTDLYSSPGNTTLGPPDVTVVGANTGPIRGSLVIDPTNPNVATFVQTSGLLPSDTYTITVTDTVKALGGPTLSSNFTTTFNVTAPTTPALSVPSFARGAGQMVDVPTSNNGLPIDISNATM